MNQVYISSEFEWENKLESFCFQNVFSAKPIIYGLQVYPFEVNVDETTRLCCRRCFDERFNDNKNYFMVSV
jgi:hypothetical protein